MLDENTARDLALRAVDRLGGVVALEDLYREGHEPYPEHEYLIGEQRVIVRLRAEARPATVDVGPYTFEVRDGGLVNVTS